MFYLIKRLDVITFGNDDLDIVIAVSIRISFNLKYIIEPNAYRIFRSFYRPSTVLKRNKVVFVAAYRSLLGRLDYVQFI